jgi:hypothetical protein
MTTIFSRPVYPRASRTADTVASVPELTKRIISTEGTWRVTNSASSTSTSVGAPYIGPSASVDWIRERTGSGRSWPKRRGP